VCAITDIFAAIGDIAADSGVADAAAAGAADAGAATAVGATAADATAVGTGVGAGLADAAGAAAIPEVTVTAPALAGGAAADFGSGIPGFLGVGAAPALAGGPGAQNVAGGGGQIGSSDPMGADTAGLTDTGIPMLGQAGPASLPPNLAAQFGVSAPGGLGTDYSSLFTSDMSASDASAFTGGDAAVSGGTDSAGAATGAQPLPPGVTPPSTVTPLSPPAAAHPAAPGGGLMGWLANPKNAMTAGMMGLSLGTSLLGPKLPSAGQTALNAAGPAVGQAQAILASGGMSGPAWSQQKASIDQSIAQQLAQAEAQIRQNAATAGQGTANSGLVQQQIAQLKSQLEMQRQQMYEQAAQANVQTAVAELTGGDQTLSAIAQMQLAQTTQARQQAALLAQLAAQLNQTSVPGG
jgi:hypothetical protein